MPRSKEGLARLVQREGVDPRIVAAFHAVDRAAFVPEGEVRKAYNDKPVAIPERQTTSQPSLIARMIDALELGPEAVVLEVGTGYGFQTALLAQVAGRVISIERHRALAEKARANLAAAGMDNASVLVGDGWEGVPEHAPYDGIVVSAAADEIPDALREQLVEGGRMVIPVRAGQGDSVLLLQRSGEELVRKALLTPACFVPLVRGRPPG